LGIPIASLERQMMHERRGTFLLLGSLLSLVAMLGYGCGCEGGSWQAAKHEQCQATGAAVLVAPERFNLPTSVQVSGGGTCSSSSIGWGCARAELATAESGDANGFKLSIETLHTQGVATYVFSTTDRPPISISAEVVVPNSPSTFLRVVSGMVTVDRSKDQELHVQFDLELVLPATDERFFVKGSTANTMCMSIDDGMVCVGGD
jgi:hypothetical protein